MQQPSSTRSAAWRQLWQDLRFGFGAHRWLIVVVTVYCSVCIAVAASYGHQRLRSPWTYAWLYGTNLSFLATMAVGVGGGFCAVYLVHLVLTRRPERPLLHAIGELARFATQERLCLAAPVLFLFPAFASSFTVVKAAIPRLNPYSWDIYFADLGRRLQGGYDAWQWLQPVFGHSPMTRFLDIVYASWFAVLYGVLFWQVFSTRDRQLRLQFLSAFVLSWIVLGSLCGTIFASAGPCFFGQVTGLPDRYAPLMDYLRSVDAEHPLIALRAQTYLWVGYLHRDLGLFDGISAMPSMHVSMVTLFALLGCRVSWRLGVPLTSFAVFIVIGSIELGWHYSVDDFAAVLGTMLIWFVAGRLCRADPAPRTIEIAGPLTQSAD
jgi:hypothetical protein